MTREEFDRWQAVTADSKNSWVEDEIFRLNGRGAMYYTGGEDGVYMKIKQDGMLELGYYGGAIPHIGEAMFRPQDTIQYDSYSAAYQSAMERGGIQFLIDMLSQDYYTAPSVTEPEMEF